MKEENKKEILTEKNIIMDIKRVYKWKTKEISFMSVLLLVFMIFSFSFVEFKLEFRFLLCNSISFVLVFLNVLSNYFLLKNIHILISKDIKYSIVVDRYIGTTNKRIGKYVIPCLNFKEYGKFELHNRESYYSWSKLCVMNNENLKRTSYEGDLFYIIVIKDKIVYLYNQRLFELR